ncbi:MAG: hypothetical protein JW894_01750 [Bacteroidales bacterium]|nr:hypothetical protein [Bacteroidales bacterium]
MYIYKSCWFNIIVLILDIVLYSEVNATDHINKSSGYRFRNTNINTLLFSTGYTSNSSLLGLLPENISQPYYSGIFSFFSKYKFDVSLMPVAAINSDTSLSATAYELDFVAGYMYTPSKKWSFYPSYTHIGYSNNMHELRSVFSDIAQLDIYYTKSLYAGSLSTGYLFGSGGMLFISFQNALVLDKKNFLFRRSLLSVSIEFDINVSDNNFYNEYAYEKMDEEGFISWVWDNYPLSGLNPVIRIERVGLEEAKLQIANILEDSGENLFGSSYKITSIGFMLPLYYSLRQFMINFTAYFIVPTSESIFYDQSSQIYFNTGLTYSFGL